MTCAVFGKRILLPCTDGPAFEHPIVYLFCEHRLMKLCLLLATVHRENPEGRYTLAFLGEHFQGSISVLLSALKGWALGADGAVHIA